MLFRIFFAFLSFNNICFCLQYSGIRIGPVVKKDVMKASIMLEHDSQWVYLDSKILFWTNICFNFFIFWRNQKIKSFNDF